LYNSPNLKIPSLKLKFKFKLHFLIKIVNLSSDAGRAERNGGKADALSVGVRKDNTQKVLFCLSFSSHVSAGKMRVKAKRPSYWNS